MPGKTLLFLNASHLQAYTWKNGVLSAPQYFTNSLEGHDQFDTFLQTHRAAVFMLTDLVEEDFRHEITPHLRGGDRTAFLRRKFDQYYPNTPFRQAVLLRRQPDGRRDDEMLFCALTNPGIILPWLDIMQRRSIPVAGIYSVPAISKPLIEGITSKNLLLLSWEKQAGLRQTYFHDQHLHFSRLTPMSDGNAFNDLVDSETTRTHQYLRSQSLLAPGEALDVFIVCHAHDRHQMEASLHSRPNIRYGYLDIQELGRRFGSRADPAGSDATLLLLHLLAAQPPRSHYAAAAHTHFFRLRRLNHALAGLGVTFAAISLLWGVINIWESDRLTADNGLLSRQATQYSQQAQETIRSLPSVTSAAADMKTAVQLMRKLDSYSPPPQKILSELSAALDTYTHIRINGLLWQGGAAPNTQTILLDGELEGMDGNYRAALDYLDRFQSTLTLHGHSVTALSLPLDVSSKGSISTNTVENSTRPAKFLLKIVWRLKE